jgi:hypothetical protein
MAEWPVRGFALLARSVRRDVAYWQQSGYPNSVLRCLLLGVRRTHIDITGVFDFAALLPPHQPPWPLSSGVTDAPGDDISGTARHN